MEGFRVGAKGAVEGIEIPTPTYRDNCPKLAKLAVRTGLQVRAVRNMLKAFSPPKVISCPPTCAVPGSLYAADRAVGFTPRSPVSNADPATL
jgi:hypothetical protein